MPESVIAERVEIDWPSVRMLAITVGVREAARRMGINEYAVLKRSQREQWLATPEARIAAANSVRERSYSALSSAVLTPAQAMAQELAGLGQKSRLSIARGLSKAAEHVETMDGQEVLIDAQNIKSTAQSLSLVHGWQNDKGTTVKVALSVTGEKTVQSVEVQSDMPVIEGAFEDDPLAGY